MHGIQPPLLPYEVRAMPISVSAMHSRLQKTIKQWPEEGEEPKGFEESYLLCTFALG